MATAAGTAIDLKHGDSNRIRLPGCNLEFFNIVDALVTAADTWTFTIKGTSVLAVLGLNYPESTYALSGETLTVTIVDIPGAETWTNVDMDICVVTSDQA